MDSLLAVLEGDEWSRIGQLEGVGERGFFVKSLYSFLVWRTDFEGEEPLDFFTQFAPLHI